MIQSITLLLTFVFLSGVCFASRNDPLVYDDGGHYLRMPMDKVEVLQEGAGQKYLLFSVDDYLRMETSIPINGFFIPFSVGTDKLQTRTFLFDQMQMKLYSIPNKVRMDKEHVETWLEENKKSLQTQKIPTNFKGEKTPETYAVLWAKNNKNSPKRELVQNLFDYNIAHAKEFEAIKQALREKAEAKNTQKRVEELKNLAKNGKIRFYNVGKDFTWQYDFSRENFEALPFDDDVHEVCSHLYKLTLSPRDIKYVVLAPRHAKFDARTTENSVGYGDIIEVYEIANEIPNEKGVLEFHAHTNIFPVAYIGGQRYISYGAWKSMTWEELAPQIANEETTEIHTSVAIGPAPMEGHIEATESPTKWKIRQYNNIEPDEPDVYILEQLPDIEVPDAPDELQQG
ncbi:hypothetical protein [Selenomonas sp. CM52]|uniref:hypothetical protein n=1 Tax=Selenomonas sp. CM52 TaxID=936381 RepID=UPI000562A889|nr:hypothetical protein [Selenomonas sp. CM52]